MNISTDTLTLPLILALLDKGYHWREIEVGNLYELYGYDPEEFHSPDLVGGSGLIEKIVSSLSPFMQFVHSTMFDYMETYKVTTQEAVESYTKQPMHTFLKPRTFNLHYVTVWQADQMELQVGKYNLAFMNIDGHYQFTVES